MSIDRANAAHVRMLYAMSRHARQIVQNGEEQSKDVEGLHAQVRCTRDDVDADCSLGKDSP